MSRPRTFSPIARTRPATAPSLLGACRRGELIRYSAELAARDCDVALLVGPFHLICVHNLVPDLLCVTSALRIQMKDSVFSVDLPALLLVAGEQRHVKLSVAFNLQIGEATTARLFQEPSLSAGHTVMKPAAPEGDGCSLEIRAFPLREG